ncbi:MAG: ABC transporter substrate-binding protein [Dehalococcoidia bacterium]|nr:ABC transporter substrate-binding protein [Dehalococcoidia bacterium]
MDTTTRDLTRPSIGRRDLLRGTALAAGGLAAAALIGCGGDDEKETATSTATAASSSTSAAANDPRYRKDPNLPYAFNYPEPDKQPKSGGTLRVAATWDVSTFDPTKSAAGGTITVPNLIYNRLLAIKAGPEANPFKIEVVPELAKSWEVTPDGLTYNFKLQEGVKWQNVAPLNGRPLVADDIAFALQRYSKEGVHQSYYVNVDSITAPDASTVRVKMKQPTPEFEVPLASRYQTIFPKDLVDSGEIDKKVIGTGAMVLQEAVTGQRVTAARNPDYWRSKALLDGVEFRLMPDASARLAAFRSGQIDYGYSVVATKTEVDQLTKTVNGLQVNLAALANSILPFGMNLSNPKFADERVRRAISLAIDRKAVNTFLFEGIGEEILHLLPWNYVFDQRPTDLGQWVKFDIAKSKQLLDAAGQKDFTINYIYYPYSTTYDRLSEVLVDQFRTAGITLKGGKVDYTEFNSQWVGAKLPEATTSGWAALGFEANTYFYNQMHSKSPGNRWQLKDPQIDEWATQQSVELDPKKRREIHKKIWDRDLDMAYRPPLPYGYAFEVLQPWLRGIRFGAILGANSSYYDWGVQIGQTWLDK